MMGTKRHCIVTKQEGLLQAILRKADVNTWGTASRFVIREFKVQTAAQITSPGLLLKIVLGLFPQESTASRSPETFK